MGEVPLNVFGQPQKPAVRVPGSLSRSIWPRLCGGTATVFAPKLTAVYLQRYLAHKRTQTPLGPPRTP